MSKRVGIIGAGASGLTAIKCCLDEGLEPICLERTGEIGGLWNFTSEVREGQGCVMKSTIINSSKEMMSYSDFPMPKEYSIFMHNTYVNKYFHQYAEHFGLLKHIRFNTEVLHAKKADDFKQSGRWKVKIQDKSGNETTEFFDALLICTGHHANIKKPSFQGQEKFKGKIIHSHEYKDFYGYENKRIVIIGIGNSGGDMAVELSRVSKVYLSTRRGSWVLNRLQDYGVPLDMHPFFGRFGTALRKCLPRSLVAILVQKKFSQRFDQEKYALKPQHNILSHHPMINDDLPNRIVCGSVTIKGDVEKFTETGVQFEDGTIEDNIDVIVLATGYSIGFPFLDKSLIEVKKNRVELFKYMFPPDLEPPTLAVIGCFRPLGSVTPISEMQCRLATQVFKGVTALPTRAEMWHDVKSKQVEMAKRYVASHRNTIQVDYLPFMDELAVLAGCKPDLKALALSDPRLAWACVAGPVTPYQFRLSGRNQWPGARDAILTQWDRTFFPLRTRPMPSSGNKYSSLSLIKAVAVLILVHIMFISLFGCW